jgi:hypothetical protein
MRIVFVVGLFGLLAVSAAGQASGQNWLIVPGKNVGPIIEATSQKDLIKIFGRTNVKLAAIDVGEGETMPGTILFPSNPLKRAYILWRDPGTRLQPKSISIKDKGTLWKTDKGITIGTTLKAIEALNGRAFAITGFAWDYEGTVAHSNGGNLTELGVGSAEDIVGRTLLLRLSPAGSARNKPEYKKVLGDKVFLSSDAAMKMINPAVYEMVVEFADQVSQSSEQPKERLLTALQGKNFRTDWLQTATLTTDSTVRIL